MDPIVMADKVKKKFESGEGQTVDVLFADSSGNLFYAYDDAEAAASKLMDKAIVPYYRDDKVRDLAKQFKELEQMVIATDYIKLQKIKKKVPAYHEYVAYAEGKGIKSITEGIFDFIKSKVFRASKPTTTGQRDQIYMFNRGVVDAIFLRRYPQGQIWQVGDTLVMTCPTNTELMSGTYKTIFGQMLGE